MTFADHFCNRYGAIATDAEYENAKAAWNAALDEVVKKCNEMEDYFGIDAEGAGCHRVKEELEKLKA